MQAKKPLTHGLSYLFLIVSTSVLLYPVIYMVLGSFTTSSRLVETILLPIPNTLNLGVIVGTWNNGLWQAYAFTLMRCILYILAALYVGLIGGYVFSKIRFFGRDQLFLIFLSGLVMPSILLLVPMYLMVAWLPLLGGNNLLGQGGHGLINDVRALFIFGWVPPFAIFLFKQSYDMLPTEYEDAAKMEGAGSLTIILQIYAPLLKPVMAAVIVVTFLNIWNDYLWPSLILTNTRPEFLPITLRIVGSGISNTSASGTPSPAGLLRILLALWPPALVYLAFQRYFVQGLVASGLKG